jgi:hypothetical protein
MLKSHDVKMAVTAKLSPTVKRSDEFYARAAFHLNHELRRRQDYKHRPRALWMFKGTKIIEEEPYHVPRTVAASGTWFMALSKHAAHRYVRTLLHGLDVRYEVCTAVTMKNAVFWD